MKLMTKLFNEKNGKWLTFGGLGIAVVGFVVQLLDAFDVADKVVPCLNSSNCNLSNNLLIVHIGSYVYRVGIAMTIVGLLILIIIKQRSKS